MINKEQPNRGPSTPQLSKPGKPHSPNGRWIDQPFPLNQALALLRGDLLNSDILSLGFCLWPLLCKNGEQTSCSD